MPNWMCSARHTYLWVGWEINLSCSIIVQNYWGVFFFPFLPKRPKLNSCFKELTKMFLGSYMFLFCIIDFLLKFIFLLFSNLAIMKQKCWFLTKAKENYSLKVSIKNSGDFLNKKIQTNLKKTSGKMSRLKALTKI